MIRSTLFLLAVAVPQLALADVMPWKMTTNQVTFQINGNLPYEGDAPTDRAGATWTAVGSRLVYVNGGLTSVTDTSQVASTDTAGTQIQGKPSRFYPGANWAGITYRTAATSTTTSDADIVVNSDKIAAGSFYYGTGATPSTQFDYETTLLHELGHVAGFEHDDNLTPYCAMVSAFQVGWQTRQPCSTERTTLKNKYGIR